MPKHYEVHSYATLAAYLAPSGIELPDLETAILVVQGHFAHYWSPWFSYGVHLLNMRRKHGVAV